MTPERIREIAEAYCMEYVEDVIAAITAALSESEKERGEVIKMDKKLEQVVNDFAAQMKKRLAEKEAEGFTGWDNPNEITSDRLLSNAHMRINQMVEFSQDTTRQRVVDTANFMMMLWYRMRKVTK